MRQNRSSVSLLSIELRISFVNEFLFFIRENMAKYFFCLKIIARMEKMLYDKGDKRFLKGFIMFNIVLIEPEIPQNTGNIVRTCAATGARLHLVRPLGFEVSDKYLKRAGLDYWHYVDISYYDNVEELFAKNPSAKFYFFTSKGKKTHSEAEYRDGDFLVFGKETAGIPEELLVRHEETCLRIPMAGDIRCLNLSNAVAVALYEALRQTGYENMNTKGRLHRLRWESETK